MNDYYLLDKSFDSTKLPEEEQKRLKYLRIPPNWSHVKVSKDITSKVQATGYDVKQRQQYIYHPAWVLFSKETKYTKINSINFNRLQIVLKKYSKFDGEYTKYYIISNMIIIMKDLNIRVGNEKYLEENDSVGLCTLSKSHYKKINDQYYFIFKGKKSVSHEKLLKQNHYEFIENIIKIPGTSLFKYKNSDNTFKKINAEDLNQFLKDYVDPEMTCKDIRTYCANEIFKKEYQTLIKNGNSHKKARIEATKRTALELGNTPKVCRDSYIDPSLYDI